MSSASEGRSATRGATKSTSSDSCEPNRSLFRRSSQVAPRMAPVLRVAVASGAPRRRRYSDQKRPGGLGARTPRHRRSSTPFGDLRSDPVPELRGRVAQTNPQCSITPFSTTWGRRYEGVVAVCRAALRGWMLHNVQLYYRCRDGTRSGSSRNRRARRTAERHRSHTYCCLERAERVSS